eukprot:GHVT01061451.1.p1 GENE.GHVT01061451.1~~GHVT01061451.1.p1  ORF type:complete len:318 (-),score=23.96 GHVT01061451.1:923-1876(-)
MLPALPEFGFVAVALSNMSYKACKQTTEAQLVQNIATQLSTESTVNLSESLPEGVDLEQGLKQTQAILQTQVALGVMYSRHRTVSKVIGILNKLPLFGTLVRQIAKKMLRQQHEAKHLREITNHVKDSRAHLLAVGVAAELCVGHRSYGKLLRNYLIKHLPIILASSTMGNQAFLNIGESHETRQAASYLGQSESNHETLHVGRDAKEHQLPHTPMSHMAREKGDTRNAEGTASTWGSHLLGSNQKLRPGFRKRQLRETKPTTRKGDLERTVGKRQTPHPTTAKANRKKNRINETATQCRGPAQLKIAALREKTSLS